MKFLKHLLTFIVSLLLFLTIFGYTLILNVKGVIEHQVIGEVVKSTISKNTSLTEEDHKRIDEIIDKVSNYDDVDELINTLIQEIGNVGEGKSVSDKTIDIIINFCVNHIDDINQLSDTKYTVEELKSQETRNDLKKSIETAYKEINKDSSKDIINIVSTYGKVTSKTSTLYVIGIIIVLLVLLGVIHLSLYKWIKPFGIVLAVSGSVVSIIYLVFNVLYDFIVKNVNLDIKIDTKTILIYGVGEILLGIVIIIIYMIINKLLTKKKKVEPTLMNNSNLTI